MSHQRISDIRSLDVLTIVAHFAQSAADYSKFEICSTFCTNRLITFTTAPPMQSRCTSPQAESRCVCCKHSHEPVLLLLIATEATGTLPFYALGYANKIDGTSNLQTETRCGLRWSLPSSCPDQHRIVAPWRVSHDTEQW